MKWMSQNAALLISIVSAVLTAVIALFTIAYTRANWRSMRAMEADFRYRSKPLPRLKLTTTLKDNGWFKFVVDVTTAQAPLRFFSLNLWFVHEGGSGHRHRHQETMQVQNSVLHLDETYEQEGEFFPGAPITDWQAELVYSDLTPLPISYRARFSMEDSQLGHEEIVEDLRKESERSEDWKAFVARMKAHKRRS